ncbi:MAG: hypothetical protein ACI3W5_16680 [Faecousia sp.]
MKSFPVGYYNFSKDEALNFQLNRFYVYPRRICGSSLPDWESGLGSQYHGRMDSCTLRAAELAYKCLCCICSGWGCIFRLVDPGSS